jgi:putative sigma-54 modulation protein
LKVTIRTETPAMKSRTPYAARKIRTAFRRMSENIREIDLVLFDVNGPRGGVDKVSRIAVDLGRGPILRLEGVGRTFRESVDGTVTRARRLVLRSLSRRRADRKRVHA